jgi:predicted Zn-dependent peptidase
LQVTIPPSTSHPFPGLIYQLPNGLTVIHQDLPASSVVTVDVWVRAGAIAEPTPWFGMAHFLEHMIFKGTDRIQPGQFDAIIERCGGITNAATSHDYAHFFINTTAEHLPEALPLLAELLLHATIPQGEFEMERQVVLEEIRQAYDDPDWIGFQTLLAAAYPQHPYGRPILGDVDELMARSPQDMRQFHRAYYQPENMTVVIVGNLSQAEALDQVYAAFQTFPERSLVSAPSVQADPPMESVYRQRLALPRLEQARLMMAWVGPGVDQLQSSYGLDLLAALLAGSQSSRLVRELREERQWVQDIDSSFSLQHDSSLFTITAWLDPDQVERVEATLGDRLSELASMPITPLELNRCKRLMCNDYAFSTETASQLAGLYGYYHTIADATLSVTYPDQVKQLTPHDLQYLAGQYLSPYRYASVVLLPEV